ncbi:MAG: SUMF1/EgtB/PvdO family nonheme iron enzyme [Planctomycetota bacterium]|nr:SUMF1/EgtB/PvdO family nonheme iron enzyme [Planctomycetota bacterium]
MSTRVVLAATAAALLATTFDAQVAKSAPHRIRMPWVLVGDPGNPSDVWGPGKVNHVYLIGRHEVTNEQYATFLNAKAALGDPLELFSVSMATDPRGGIVRVGSGTVSDPFLHVPRPFSSDKPVSFVSWFDALRFVNWMHNGTGEGDTESGAYTLLGGTPIPSNGDSIARNPGAGVVLPSENEWFKAAYYDPSAFGGAGAYWLYAAQTSATPTPALATVFGGVANPGSNVANYNGFASWGGLSGNLTTVGSAGPLSRSYYGCADMNGNVSEWSETFFTWSGTLYRINRGGTWELDETIMDKDSWAITVPYLELDGIGFRVARVLP